MSSGPWDSLSLCLLGRGSAVQVLTLPTPPNSSKRTERLQQGTKTQERVSLLPLQLVTVLSLNQSLALGNAAVCLDCLGLATVEAR